jgi:hypothetical protein
MAVYLQGAGRAVRRILSGVPLGDFSPIVPLKYYKYLSEDRRVWGDVGKFRIPIDMALTLRK